MLTYLNRNPDESVLSYSTWCSQGNNNKGVGSMDTYRGFYGIKHGRTDFFWPNKNILHL